MVRHGPLEMGDTDPELRKPPELADGAGLHALRARFVGRGDALHQLRQLFALTREARKLSFVTLVGEPGAGKSRLADEFARSIRASVPDARVLAGAADSPAGPSYEAVIGLLAARFGLAQDEPPEDARRKIQSAVEERVPARLHPEVTQLLAHLLGLPLDESPVVERLAQLPGQLEVRTFVAVRRFFECDAQHGPLVLYVDGMERAGTETVNLVHYLADGLGDCPVMILATARPTLFRRHPHWGQGDFPHHRVELEPLRPMEAQALFCELVPLGSLPEELLQVARDRLRGSPRAIYEFAHYLIEGGVLVPGREWTLAPARLAGISLPRSHEEILRARLQALPERHRAALEKAAAVGEVFWLDAVVALVRAAALTPSAPDGPSLEEIAAAGDRSRAEVADLLGDLCERGLLSPCGQSSIAGETEYRFAYPPIWDLAYELLQEPDRRRYHRLVAQWLELRPEGREEARQELVGRHLQRAGDGPSAAARYRRAADAARKRYFNHKAIRLYERALACAGEGDVASRLHLWHDLGSVYQLKGDVDGALDAFERMMRLSWVVASRSKAAVAFNKIGRLWRQKGNLELSLQYLERGLEMFRQAEDHRGVATSLDDIGQVYWLLGRYEDALDRSAKSLEMRRQLGDRRSIAVSLSNIGNIEKNRGLLDEANSCYQEALRLQQEVGDRYGQVVSLNNLGALAFEKGRLEEARDKWEDALAEAEQIGALPLQVILLNNLGETAMRLGKLPDARQRLQKAVSLAAETEEQRVYIEVLRNLGMVELQEGNREKAKKYCEECLTMANNAQLPELIGKAHLALGEVHAATLFDASVPSSDASSADVYFLRAVGVFREMRNEGELAKALKRLGEYLVERGQIPEARTTLAEAAELLEKLGLAEGASVRKMVGELAP
ncbi:MAG: tetratricopeptide repeat protein [Deltaproteobacteria bacterium]|nr:tetratricopeptide repeat protein [Deltaproteobacteria bacterium]